MTGNFSSVEPGSRHAPFGYGRSWGASSEEGLPEEADGVGRFPSQEQGDDEDPFGQGRVLEVRAESGRDALVESEVIADTPGAAGATFLVEDAGTATVPEIHPKELGDRLGVVVFDEGFGGVHERPAPLAPAITQVAIFGGREREVRVEAAQFQEVGPAAADVVAGEKGGGAARWIEVLVDEVEDELVDAGLAVGVGAIPGVAADHGMGVGFHSAGQGLDPVRGRHAIVVREEEDPGLTAAGSELARDGRTGVLLVDDPEPEGRREASGVDSEGFGAAIIHQQDFERRMIQGLPAECGKAAGCGLGPASAGNDDLDANTQTAFERLPEWGAAVHGAVGSIRPGMRTACRRWATLGWRDRWGWTERSVPRNRSTK